MSIGRQGCYGPLQLSLSVRFLELFISLCGQDLSLVQTSIILSSTDHFAALPNAAMLFLNKIPEFVWLHSFVLGFGIVERFATCLFQIVHLTCFYQLKIQDATSVYLDKSSGYCAVSGQQSL